MGDGDVTANASALKRRDPNPLVRLCAFAVLNGVLALLGKTSSSLPERARCSRRTAAIHAEIGTARIPHI